MECPGEHQDDGNMKAVAGFNSSLGKGHKNQSKVWEEFQPIFMHGKVEFAVCLSCHNPFCYSGDSYLCRHLKTCPAKPEVAERPQEDSYFPNATLEDISSVIPNRKLRSKNWKGLTPIYVDGKLDAADCNYCHKRLSKSGGHLTRHVLACPKRPGRARSHQKGNRSVQPNLKSRVSIFKSRVQNKSSLATTVPITKCKILREQKLKWHHQSA